MCLIALICMIVCALTGRAVRDAVDATAAWKLDECSLCGVMGYWVVVAAGLTLSFVMILFA